MEGEVVPVKVMEALTKDGLRRLADDVGIEDGDIIFVTRTDGWGRNIVRDLAELQVKAVVLGADTLIKSDPQILPLFREANIALLSDRDAGALLERVGLDAGFLDRPADRLSGGEAQRMCLARTLATMPEVLLADEATSSLDPEATRRLETLALALRDVGIPVIWVTQEPEQIDRIADHAVRVTAGRVEVLS